MESYCVEATFVVLSRDVTPKLFFKSCNIELHYLVSKMNKYKPPLIIFAYH